MLKHFITSQTSSVSSRLLLPLVLLLITVCACDSSSNLTPRQKINFDFDWKFSKGDFPEASSVVFDDSGWQEIDVPHDWSILDTFSKENPTGKSGGYASGGVGW